MKELHQYHMNKMNIKGHKCTLKDDKRTTLLVNEVRPGSTTGSCKRLCLGMIVMWVSHPMAGLFFKSPVEIKKEKIRHLSMKNPWVIHPLSKFRLFYEMWLCFLYTFTLLQKPMDSAFGSTINKILWYRELSLICDFLSWIDILINFHTGYIVKSKKTIELRLRKIFWNYVTGPFFICDVLSSFPKFVLYKYFENPSLVLLGTINLVLYLKVIRLKTLLDIYKTVSIYFGIEVKHSLFMTMFKALASSIIIMHYFGCLEVTIPNTFGKCYRFFDESNSWSYSFNLMQSNVFRRYLHAFFRVAAHFFGIRLQYIYERSVYLDYCLAIMGFFLGKFILCTIWVVMCMSIINSRQMSIKYSEMLDQVNEFMTNRDLPIQLRDRIMDYYKYNYQKKYVNEKLIFDLLPTVLKDEINLQLCKILLRNVTIFAGVDPHVLNQIVKKLQSEIYLSGDPIISSGSNLDAMYFIDNGTVAVYTYSGKEVCHLGDGDYFGEVFLLLKNESKMASVVAIETSKVYILHKKYFDRYIKKDTLVYEKICKVAENRKKLLARVESQYRKSLFEEEFGGNVQSQPSIMTIEK